MFVVAAGAAFLFFAVAAVSTAAAAASFVLSFVCVPFAGTQRRSLPCANALQVQVLLALFPTTLGPALRASDVAHFYTVYNAHRRQMHPCSTALGCQMLSILLKCTRLLFAFTLRKATCVRFFVLGPGFSE